MNMKGIVLCVLVGLTLTAGAQVPVITNVEPLASAPQQKILITGSGFSSTSSQLRVWFDHVQGTIISSSNFSIQATVPAQARYSNVEVINVATGLSAKSSLKFSPQFGGSSFDATKVSAAFSVTDPAEPFDICSCDFDLDGLPDLATSKSTGGSPATDLMILKNASTLGTLSFSKVDKTTLPALDVSAPTFNINCGDLNGDGKPDLVATRNGATRNQVFVLKNTNSSVGTLSFGAVQTLLLDIGQFAFRVSIRDLNLDGKPELIVSNSFDDPATDNIVYVYTNQSSAGTISFAASPLKLTVTGAATTYGLDVQDLDGDQKPEIILNQFQTNNLYIFKNQSAGQVAFAPVQQIGATGAFNNVTSGDMNMDGLLDLIVSGTFDNTVQLFINQSTPGNISFKTPQVIPTAAGPWGVDVSDIDGDGDPDIIVANRNDTKVNVLRQDASLTFTKLDLTTSKPPRNVRAGDFDGDGKPDIAYTTFSGLQFSVDVIRNMNCVSPKILNALPVTVCSGQTIRLLSTPALGVTFDWSKNAAPPFQSGPNEYADINSAGSYTVTATGESGACVVTSPAVVVGSNASAPPADPTIMTNAPLCLGSNLTLSTPTVGGATYQWTGPSGFSTTTQNPTINNVTAGNAGLYNLQLSAGGCMSNVVSSQVDVASLPVFTISSSVPGAGCQGTPVTLSVTNAPGYTYQWRKNSVDIGGQTGLTLAASTEGAYSVTVTSTSPTCSVETSQTNVVLLAVPVAAFQSPASACVGAAASFTDQTIFDARGTSAWAWAFGDGNTSTLQNPSNTYNSAGNPSVSLTASYTGVAGCSNLISKGLPVNTPVVPVITPSANPICPGDPTTLSVAGTFNTYTWNTGGSSSSIDITQPGDYSVNTVDANSCASTANLTVSSKPTITMTVSADKTSINPGEPVQLTASGADTYLWSPSATLDNPAIANPVAKPTTTTTYTVVGSVTGSCDAKDSVTVTVNNGGAAAIKPPLIFSPNGDGINDMWIVVGVENYPDCTMSIYDGHGSKVYDQKGYNSSNGWDGTYSGKAVPDGTYYYVFGCPDLRPATGNIQIVH